MHVIPLQAPNLKAVMITYPLHDAHVGVDQYDAYPTRAGQDRFINFKVPPAESEKKEPEYWFAKYSFATDGSLELFMPNSKQLQEDITTGKLTGKVWTTSFDSNVALNDTSENLLKYFHGTDVNKKFQPFATFHRVVE